MKGFNKSIAIASVAALAIALSGAALADTKGSAELQQEIISGVQPAAGAEVKEPVRADTADGSAADKAEDKTEQMLKRQADELSGDTPVAIGAKEVKEPVSADRAEGSAADKSEDKTEQMLKDSAEAVSGPK
ncbi:MAG: hypothetical protein LJE70_05770 [Chromatiaceae bacterium]|jgi:hypothetical protein|nr:hypothetical protein [Chromatiaceae bacterium]